MSNDSRLKKLESNVPPSHEEGMPSTWREFIESNCVFFFWGEEDTVIDEVDGEVMTKKRLHEKYPDVIIVDYPE